MNLSEKIEKIISKENLSQQESYETMRDILTGQVAQAQIASLLTALRCKGESAEEITGFVKAMREAMVSIESKAPILVDTCGTGGDGKKTFNISTAAAFVVSGAGYPVAKHGNRSISSQCGSADLLEAAGVKIEMTKETALKCLEEIGITFLYAPLYHPAMKNVGPTRKEMGIRTVFNLLGPLVNPAKANVQMVGVPNDELLKMIAQVFLKLNHDPSHSAMVVHDHGYDEIVLSGKGKSAFIKNGKVKYKNCFPSDFKLTKKSPEILRGGDARANAQILADLLKSPSHPLAEIVLANAALALLSAHSVDPAKKGSSLLSAFRDAQDSLKSGEAYHKLEQLIEWSHKV